MSGEPVRRVLLATGGTGGHMFPAEALARELRARGVEVVLVTDRRGAGFGGDLAEVETYRIRAGGIAGGSLPKRLHGLASLAFGYLQARRLVPRLGADAVVGLGSYASVPTVLAGAAAGLRVILHEQNAVAGRANRLLARRAHAIAAGFAEVRGLRPGDLDKTVHTGNPVRPEIAKMAGRPYRAPRGDEPVGLLVFGGSQGARVFNTVVPAALARLPEALRGRLRVTQQVPGAAMEEVRAAYRACGVEAELAGFFGDMPRRLAAAHVVICRAGASTVFELARVGRPAILVPYPYATDDHQTANAQALCEAGGGWLIPQAALGPEALAGRLESLLATPALLERAAAAAAGFAPGEAARRLADLVMGAAGSNGDDAAMGDGPREAAA